MDIYLDHAAGSPVRAEAREAWLRASEVVGNASSIHGQGQRARRMLEDAREGIAEAVDCDPIEVVFTSGGTESINLALQGTWRARAPQRSVIVLPDGEHHATMDTVAWLASQGAEVRPVQLTSTGRVDPDRFAAALAPDVVIATALVANNEVGTINDVAALAERAEAQEVPLHLDAVAAFGSVPLSFATLRGKGAAGVVAMSISGHKVGAPAGTGALIVSRHAAMKPLLHGGAAQRDLRGGTQDIAGAAAFAAAATLAAREARAAAAAPEHALLPALRDRLMRGIERAVPQASVLGDRDHRLPGNVHVLFPGATGESMLYLLDQHGIAVSTGSACQAGIAEPSHVVQALGLDAAAARSVLRFSLGRTSSDTDVDAVLGVIAEVYRRAGGDRS